MDEAIELIVQTLAEDDDWQGNLTDDELACLLETALCCIGPQG